MCERASWLRLFDLKLLDRLLGKRSCCNFHICFACFRSKVSSKGRMDKCLKRGIGSSSWVLNLIILMAFLVFLLIFSILASGAVPQLRRL